MKSLVQEIESVTTGLVVGEPMTVIEMLSLTGISLKDMVFHQIRSPIKNEILFLKDEV
jgi:hypothetical protein